MKYIALLLIILCSCTRGRDLTPDDPEISFDINGKHFSYIGNQTAANGSVGVFAAKSSGIPGGLTNTFYSFAGYKNTGNIIQILIATPNDTLKPTTYNQGIGIMLESEGNQYIFSQASIAISDYKNGVVNGSFTGTASKVINLNPSVLSPVAFSNGRIKNVRINY